MPTIYIDGKEYKVGDGLNMLEAVLSSGLDLPYFCWHPAMRSVGACRQCAVKIFRDENDTKGRIVMACMTPAVEGTRISISDPEANQFRKYVIEWLMTNHPHDCPICDEGGECHLQDMTAMTGHVYRRFTGKKRTHNNQQLGPFINHEMNRCIQCWRCVRFYRDTAGGKDFGVFGSRNRVYFGRQKDGTLESEFSGNLVEVCPTGVFTDKTLKRHYTRKWDLQTAPSVCIHCGLGCNTFAGERYGTVRRITARYNSDVNGHFICDRGRFGYEFLSNSTRIKQCRINDISLPVSLEATLAHVDVIAKNAKRMIGIGSPRASLESNYALWKRVGADSFSTGLSKHEQRTAEDVLKILSDPTIQVPSLAEVQTADSILILGADPTNEAPMLDLSIRQAMKKACIGMARALKIPDWDANAVAEALQGTRGKLFIASPWRIKLQEISEAAAAISYSETVDLAYKVVSEIRSTGSTGDQMAANIANALMAAEKPLVVTSMAAGADLLAASVGVVRALQGADKECRISVIVPEANTLGVVMLGGFSVDEAVDLVESGGADTIFVIENDLSRRINPKQLKMLADKCSEIVTLDSIDTKTSAIASTVIPVSSWVESDGTFVNNEGRAQRYYQVYIPAEELLQPWDVIQRLGCKAEWGNYNDVLKAMAQDIPAFAGVLNAGANADWRSATGQKVPRMSHRSSGRTSKDANWTMNEPQPPDDPGTPYAFSMEGDKNSVPGAITPRYWWPGWNSVNSLAKFQTETGSSLIGGNAGTRITVATGNVVVVHEEKQVPLAKGEVWLIPRPYIFGSDELSRFSPGIAELAPKPEICIHPETAQKLGLGDGDMFAIHTDGVTIKLIVRYDTGLAGNVATVPAGYHETTGVTRPMRVTIVRSE